MDQPSYAGHTALYCALHRPNKEVQALLKAGGASDTRQEEEEEEEEEEKESEEVRIHLHGEYVESAFFVGPQIFMSAFQALNVLSTV